MVNVVAGKLRQDSGEVERCRFSAKAQTETRKFIVVSAVKALSCSGSGSRARSALRRSWTSRKPCAPSTTARPALRLTPPAASWFPSEAAPPPSLAHQFRVTRQVGQFRAARLNEIQHLPIDRTRPPGRNRNHLGVLLVAFAHGTELALRSSHSDAGQRLHPPRSSRPASFCLQAKPSYLKS